MANSSSFSITIKDLRSNTDPITFNIEALGWILLSNFGDKFFIYSWSEQDWQPINKDEYAKFKSGYSYAEIGVGVPKDQQWIELPMTGKPAMMNELSEFADPFETEDNLPPELEIARKRFIEDR